MPRCWSATRPTRSTFSGCSAVVDDRHHHVVAPRCRIVPRCWSATRPTRPFRRRRQRHRPHRNRRRCRCWRRSSPRCRRHRRSRLPFRRRRQRHRPHRNRRRCRCWRRSSPRCRRHRRAGHRHGSSAATRTPRHPAGCPAGTKAVLHAPGPAGACRPPPWLLGSHPHPPSPRRVSSRHQSRPTRPRPLAATPARGGYTSGFRGMAISGSAPAGGLTRLHPAIGPRRYAGPRRVHQRFSRDGNIRECAGWRPNSPAPGRRRCGGRRRRPPWLSPVGAVVAASTVTVVCLRRCREPPPLWWSPAAAAVVVAGGGGGGGVHSDRRVSPSVPAVPRRR